MSIDFIRLQEDLFKITISFVVGVIAGVILVYAVAREYLGDGKEFHVKGSSYKVERIQ